MAKRYTRDTAPPSPPGSNPATAGHHGPRRRDPTTPRDADDTLQRCVRGDCARDASLRRWHSAASFGRNEGWSAKREQRRIWLLCG